MSWAIFNGERVIRSHFSFLGWLFSDEVLQAGQSVPTAQQDTTLSLPLLYVTPKVTNILVDYSSVCLWINAINIIRARVKVNREMKGLLPDRLRKPNRTQQDTAAPTVRKILFVGKYEDYGVSHFPIVNYPMKFLSGLVYAISVCAVHYEDEALSPCVVVSPQRPNLVLSSHVLKDQNKRLLPS